MLRERSASELSLLSGTVGGVDLVAGGSGNVERSRALEADTVLDVEAANGGDRAAGGGELGDNGHLLGGVELEVGSGTVEVGVADTVGVDVATWDGS